ncbi:MAG TPA: GNAT family N-acetyltransferase [bacterium]|nr:GNAT family N-acetyltransferase [bacterium]
MNSSVTMSQPVEVRRAQPTDVERLVALHHAAFGSQWTDEHWRHRYDRGPVQRGEVVAAFSADGRCLATFCGVVLPCRFAGEPGLVCRAGDVAVHPELQTNPAGPRLLLRVCSRFVDELRGSVGFIFGFPQPGLSRTLIRHCRYEVMADVCWLVSGRDALPKPQPNGPTISTDGHVPDDADRMLAELARQTPSGLVRDQRYLRWRYLRQPESKHAVLTARSATGAVIAAAVVGCNSQHDDAVVIAEWLVPRQEHATAGALLSGVRSFAASQGRQHVVTAFQGHTPEFAEMQQAGFRVQVSPHQFVYRPYSNRMSRRFLFDNWYWSPGDLDFI